MISDGIDQNLDTTVTHRTAIGDGGVVEIWWRRYGILINQAVNVAVVEVDGTREAAVEYGPVDTNVGLLLLLPLEVGVGIGSRNDSLDPRAI